MKKENLEITEEKLNEIEKKTKEDFTRFLIKDLKEKLDDKKEPNIYKIFAFERILELIEHETKRNTLDTFSKNKKSIGLKPEVFFKPQIWKNRPKGRGIEPNLSNKYKDKAYELITTLRGKKRRFLLNGEFLLSEISEMIQKEFDSEPFHLYEFEIGQYKFGPECDEWQEIFDSLDNFKLGSVISVAGINKEDTFRFLYDFGDKIRFKIEIRDIKKLSLKV